MTGSISAKEANKMVLLIMVAAVIGLPCLFLTMRAIFTRRHLEVQETLVSSPLKSLAAGVATALAVLGIFVGLQSTELAPLALGSVAMAAIAGTAALFGLATVASVTGERVLGLRNRESSPFAQTGVGTLLLVIMGALPFLGWFLVGPIAAALGLGAVVIAIARGAKGSRTLA